MTTETYDIRLTSASPITVRSTTLIDRQEAFTELVVTELRMLIERNNDAVVRVKGVIANLERSK